MPPTAPYPLALHHFTAPTNRGRPMTIQFRLPPPTDARDPLRPATALQVSVADVFLGRQTARDIAASEADPGLCTLRIPRDAIPRFTGRVLAQMPAFEVKVHAWRGEKHLGAWEVGVLEREMMGVE